MRRLRRLASEAQKIAEILTEDFRRMGAKLEGIRAAAASPGSAGAKFGASTGADDEAETWAEGISVPGEIEKTDPSTRDRGDNPQEGRSRQTGGRGSRSPRRERQAPAGRVAVSELTIGSWVMRQIDRSTITPASRS